MPDIPDGRIWRYMDLAKFAVLLASRSLYFACPSQLSDPYEGLVPRSHAEAEKQIFQKHVDDLLALRGQFVERAIPIERFDATLQSLGESYKTARRDAALKFGISCWHESEYESEAMWKLYSASGQAIAIESTIAQLKASLGDTKNIQMDRVRYMDFEHDPIEKGHRHYGLFIKRKSFEHEKEFRATILLEEPGKGVSVPCNLDILVTRIHVSPFVEEFVKDAVVAVCKGTTQRLDKPICHSQLLSPPDYGMTLNTGI